MNSIVTQKWYDDSLVEIIVSDNASDDDTESLVVLFQQKYANIKYHKNETNIGANPNFLVWIELCHGEYVSVMGSDDFLLPWWLERILNVIKIHVPDLILSNYYEFFDVEVKLDNLHYEKNHQNKLYFKWLSNFINYLSNSKIDVFKMVWLFSFISIFCFKRGLFADYKNRLILSLNNVKWHGALDYVENHYFNIPLILYSGLWKDNNIVMINEFVVWAQRNNMQSTWSIKFKIIQDFYILLKSTFGKVKSIHFLLFYKLLSWRILFWIGSKIKKILLRLRLYSFAASIWSKYPFIVSILFVLISVLVLFCFFFLMYLTIIKIF